MEGLLPGDTPGRPLSGNADPRLATGPLSLGGRTRAFLHEFQAERVVEYGLLGGTGHVVDTHSFRATVDFGQGYGNRYGV